MENCSQRHYKSIKKALKRVGLMVDEIEKQGRKTVITVFHSEADGKTAASSEKQRVKSD